MCGVKDLIEYETVILAGLGFLLICYSKTLKHLLTSRCTEINFCGIFCKRDTLSDDITEEIINYPENL
jgi:hypothetical protein